MTDPIVLLTATLLALAAGANDGATIVAVNLAGRGLDAVTASIALAIAVFALPLLLGTSVATTLAHGLVAGDPATRQLATVVATVVSVVVVLLASSRGLPTSLTLALIGAVVGVGIGMDQAVTWSTVAGIGALAVVAPLAALTLAFRLGRAGLGSYDAAGRRSRLSHAGAFLLQAFAYGINDGQKMIVALLAGGVAGSADLALPALLVIAVAFGVGTIAWLPRASRQLGRGVLATRPVDAMNAQLVSSVTVLTGALLGTPLSMTQSTAAGLVGSGLTRGTGSIRWAPALRIVGGWLLTLPMCAAAGWAAARLLVVR